MLTATEVVQCPAERPGVGEHERGKAARDRILEELVRRWEAFEPTPSEYELAESLGIHRMSVRHHAQRLREVGLLHPTALWPTPEGYRLQRGALPPPLS